MISGFCAAMPLVRNAVTFSFCQTARSSRSTIANLVSNMNANSTLGNTTLATSETSISCGGSNDLERSCTQAITDSIKIAPASGGIERIEAHFHGNAFDPHRHDTYALGLT